MTRLRGLTKSRALHFVVLGAALFGARATLSPGAERPPARIVVTADTTEMLTREWTRTSGHPPTSVELDALVRDHVDEELLFREALALGLHHRDALVARRLIRNQRFLLAPRVAPEPTDAELLARAFELQMEQTDLVVRRRLVERMRELILAKAASERPRAPIAHSSPSREPTVRFHHLFLSRDRRGAGTRAAAHSLQTWLRDENVRPGDSRLASRGDPLLVPRTLGPVTRARLATRLGESFAGAVMEAESGRWTGPFPSPYGLHLVWVDEVWRSQVSPGGNVSGSPWTSGVLARERQERAELRTALDVLRRNVNVVRTGGGSS